VITRLLPTCPLDLRTCMHPCAMWVAAFLGAGYLEFQSCNQSRRLTKALD